jgi:hypothetical protein
VNQPPGHRSSYGKGRPTILMVPAEFMRTGAHRSRPVEYRRRTRLVRFFPNSNPSIRSASPLSLCSKSALFGIGSLRIYIRPPEVHRPRIARSNAAATGAARRGSGAIDENLTLESERQFPVAERIGILGMRRGISTDVNHHDHVRNCVILVDLNSLY